MLAYYAILKQIHRGVDYLSKLTLYNKFRPRTLDEVVGQEHIKKVLSSHLANETGHAFIFAGLRGSGKTSSARIFAKSLNCDNTDYKPCNKCSTCLTIDGSDRYSLDVLEIDSASARGIDDAKQLRDFLNYSPSPGKKKVIILDEVHMLTKEAWNALLKTIEEAPDYVVFIFVTTELHKVPATIISRCEVLKFTAIPDKEILERLIYISKAEEIKIRLSEAEKIVKSSGGSMRDAISILEQAVNLAEDKIIDIGIIDKVVGLSKDEIAPKLIDLVIKGDDERLLLYCDQLGKSGMDMQLVLKDLMVYVGNLLVVKKVPKPEELLSGNISLMRKQASDFSSANLLEFIELCERKLNNFVYNLPGNFILSTCLLWMMEPYE